MAYRRRAMARKENRSGRRTRNERRPGNHLTANPSGDGDVWHVPWKCGLLADSVDAPPAWHVPMTTGGADTRKQSMKRHSRAQTAEQDGARVCGCDNRVSMAMPSHVR